MEVLSVATELWTAFTSGSSFQVANLIREPETWIIFFVPFVIAVALTVAILRTVPFVDRNLEKWLLIVIYLVMAAIIFVGVIRRFVFSVQAPWSTTMPAWLFLVLTWLGAAYSIKRRTQLNFGEIRSRMSRKLQLGMLGLDWFLWTAFSYIVVVTTLRRTVSSWANFQILPGTDDIMQWWFYAAVPVSWVLLSARAWMIFTEDRQNYRENRPLVGLVSVTDTE